jgi:DNA ligase-1
MSAFKPNLAGKAPDDLRDLKFPVYVSPKLDGIRCLMTNKGPVSRNLKPIANDYVREYLDSIDALRGCDGELIVGEPTGNDVMNRTSSGVMRKDGKPDFRFHVFDNFCLPDVFKYRLKKTADMLERLWESGKRPLRVQMVEQIVCHGVEQLMEIEERYVSQGYEGAMIRDRMAFYKFGRSTTTEGGLLKLKRFEDHEATVVDMVERMHNGNEATKDALGHTKRSTHKANKTGTDMMGALECITIVGTLPVRFEIGTGFTEAQRKEIWTNGAKGRIVKFKCQGFTPEDKKPRFPVFLGFRDEADMDAKEMIAA